MSPDKSLIAAAIRECSVFLTARRTPLAVLFKKAPAIPSTGPHIRDLSPRHSQGVVYRCCHHVDVVRDYHAQIINKCRRWARAARRGAGRLRTLLTLTLIHRRLKVLGFFCRTKRNKQERPPQTRSIVSDRSQERGERGQSTTRRHPQRHLTHSTLPRFLFPPVAANPDHGPTIT